MFCSSKRSLSLIFAILFPISTYAQGDPDFEYVKDEISDICGLISRWKSLNQNPEPVQCWPYSEFVTVQCCDFDNKYTLEGQGLPFCFCGRQSYAECCDKKRWSDYNTVKEKISKLPQLTDQEKEANIYWKRNEILGRPTTVPNFMRKCDTMFDDLTIQLAHMIAREQRFDASGALQTKASVLPVSDKSPNLEFESKPEFYASPNTFRLGEYLLKSNATAEQKVRKSFMHLKYTLAKKYKLGYRSFLDDIKSYSEYDKSEAEKNATYANEYKDLSLTFPLNLNYIMYDFGGALFSCPAVAIYSFFRRNRRSAANNRRSGIL